MYPIGTGSGIAKYPFAEGSSSAGLLLHAALMRNRAVHFPVGQLMAFLIALGPGVEVMVKPSRNAQGQISAATGQQD